MASYEQEIYDLEQVLGYLGRQVDYQKEPHAPQVLSQGLSYYRQYFKLHEKLKKTPEFAQDPRVQDYASFQELVAPTQLNDIIQFFRSLGQEESEIRKTKAPDKEESTVPAELETLVAQYKEAQADRLEADTSHSVADAVKRARKTWETKNRAEMLRENRLAKITDPDKRQKQKEIEDLQRDQFLTATVDPKAESAHLIYKNTHRLARQAVIAQASNLGLGLSPTQINKAVDDLTYLGLTGSVDFTNFHDLNIVSQLVFINQGIPITSPINQVDHAVIAWQKEINDNPYSDKPDELEGQIILADQEIEEKMRQSVIIFENKLKENRDLDNDLEAAQKELNKIHDSLLKAIPNAKLPPLSPTPLEEQGQLLETLLRKADPSLSISTDGLASRTIAILDTTHSSNRNISPESLKLFSLGLDAKKLDVLIQKDPTLRAYFATEKGKSVFQQVHFQLRKIEDSKLGQDIRQNLPLSNGLSKFYNQLSPKIQTASKVILDPIGTAKSWINKKIGQKIGKELIAKAGSTLSKKLGNYLLTEGLKEGVKKFALEATKKVALEVAKKVGLTVAGDSLIATIALALGVPTAGLSLVIGAALIVLQAVADVTIGVVKKGLDKVWQEAGWGDKFRSRDLLIPVAAVGTTVAVISAGFFTKMIILRRSIQIAIVSAFGIIISSVIAMGLYLTFTFLVAPILSTIVQFDSLEKVDYAEYGGGGAYGGGGGPGPGGGGGGGGGGVVNLDCGPDAGAEIMVQAGSFPVIKKLLTGAGRTGYCIIPTKIVIHWSGGWTNNDVTYNVLEERGLSCQIGTDQDGSVQQWQQLWEKKAELAYCVGGNENNYCLNNEMVGSDFIPPGTPPIRSGQKPPNESEIQSSVNSTCFFMKQYGIPYTQIFGHYELHPGKPDPGEEFLAYFINRVKEQCP